MSKSKFKFFKKRANEEKLGIQELKGHIPCSLEAIDFSDSLYIQGKSVIKEEIAMAIKVPE